MINETAKILPDTPAQQADPEVAQYVATCGRILGKVLPPLLSGLFQGVDDALYDLADKATSNRQYTLYFDAMRIIRKHSRMIQQSFLHGLRIGAENAVSGRPLRDPRIDEDVDLETLALVSNVELEEILAVDNLVSKAESRYRRELMEMNHHLAHKMGLDEADSRVNPYSPHAICEAFRASVAAIRQIDAQIRLVVYKAFDRQVMDRLGDFYSRCLDVAVAEGHRLGSGLTQSFRGKVSNPQPVAASSRPPAPEKQFAAGMPALSASPTITLPTDTYNALRGIIAQQRAHTPPPASRGIELRTVELLALLTSLGARVLMEGRAAMPSRLTAVAGRVIQSGRRIAPRDEDTLDLIQLFFDHLFQGNDLPDGIKAVLGRMQIPLAKLALIDKGFFSDPSHPARRLLNHIGEAAVGWSEDCPRGPDSLYGMIERVVERLILDYDGDPAIFARMDRFFVAFIAHESAQARKAEADCLAEIEPDDADPGRQKAGTELRILLSRYPKVFPLVENILRQGWLPGMAATYQQVGSDDPAWHAGIELADKLLWSVQPKGDAEQRRQLLRRIPETLRNLRALLTQGGCDQRQMARWFKELQTIHLGVIQGEDPATIELDTASEDLSNPSSQLAEDDTGRGLAIGTWIELARDDGTKTRFKVAWVGPDGSDHLLVDRQGRRGPDLSAGELEKLRDQGLARVLVGFGEPITDRALRSVMDLASGTTH